ncbi:MAG: ABC transporter permease [Treponema sp.]|nr:ABC transporter permease [Treponema sp.]
MANNDISAVRAAQVKAFFKNQNVFLSIMILVLAVLVQFAAPRFLSISNIINLFQTVSLTGIMTIGMAMVIITGNIDLSVAYLVSFDACLTATLLRLGILNDGTALPFGLLLGLACGVVNGLLVAKTKAEAFILTLGTMCLFQGLGLVAVSGNVASIGTMFLWFGTAKIGRIPIQTVIFVILAAIVSLIMRYTKFGRRVYSVGGNPEAAYLAGINVKRYKILVFSINGFLCGITAMLVLSRLSAANYSMTLGYEMEAITACVVGGVSLSGGQGNVLGCFLGVMLMGVISNSLNLLMIPIFYHKIIFGIVLLIAVILRTRRQSDGV